MEGCAEKEDVPLVCIGFKYNLKKVIVFLSTKGAASTQPGEPYLAKTTLAMCVQEKLRSQTSYQIISTNQTWWTYIIKHDRQS